MDRIPPWIINKGGKVILKNGQKQVEGGDDPHGTNQTVPGLGTVRGTNGAEVETDPYSNWARELGWDQFDYNAFTAAVDRNMKAGMDAEQATNAAAAEMIRSNPSLADQAEKDAQGVQPSGKSRDAAQPLAGDIIKEMNAKGDGPTARQIEADVARYLEAGFPAGAAAAMARQNAEQDLEKEQEEKKTCHLNSRNLRREVNPLKGRTFLPRKASWMAASKSSRLKRNPPNRRQSSNPPRHRSQMHPKSPPIQRSPRWWRWPPRPSTIPADPPC